MRDQLQQVTVDDIMMRVQADRLETSGTHSGYETREQVGPGCSHSLDRQRTTNSRSTVSDSGVT